MDGWKLTYLLAAIAALAGIFFLIREIMCWYYKINRRVELQEETNKLLKRLIDIQQGGWIPGKEDKPESKNQ